MPDRILAIGAHPDDVEFGCAGVLISEKRQGNSVKILVLSKGEAGTNGTPAEREMESRRAAEIIGAEVEFLDFGGDCHVDYTPANAIRIAGEIRAYRPDIVLAPHLDENQHPDHARVGKLTRDAARLSRFGGLQELRALPVHAIRNLYYYAVTQEFGITPDVIVDISSVKDAWEQAMLCHATQGKTKRYAETRLAVARSLGLLTGVEYALGLYRNDPVFVNCLSDLQGSSRNF